MPPDDPLGRHGPSLDNFLRKRPILPEQKKQPCPYGEITTGKSIHCVQIPSCYNPLKAAVSKVSLEGLLSRLPEPNERVIGFHFYMLNTGSGICIISVGEGNHIKKAG